jgi:DNA-directed RNA polymerase I and III subunit RPAC1
VSYANTLRRIILCEVPTVGFRAEILKDGSTSDIKIEKNTTAMSNEMLAHRIGLLPVHASPVDWDPDRYIFKLDVENKSNSVKDVFASDIEVYELIDGTPTPVDNAKFFKKNLYTNDTCLIATLKPNLANQTPETIAFTAKATVGIGKENMRYSTVSQCSYSYTRDNSEAKEEQLFIKWLDSHKKINSVDLDSERLATYKREFETMEVARCYVMNAKGEPSSFDFTVETVGVHSPYDIVADALRILVKRCYAYAAIDKGDLPDSVKIQPTKKEAKGYDIYFQNEDHTLGNLLTTWMDENILDPTASKEGTISYCGYCIPHPLRDEMLMTIVANDINITRKAISVAAGQCSKMFSTWSTEWSLMQ